MRSVKREQRASKTGRPHPSHLPTNKVTWVPVRAEQRRPAPSSSSSITLSIIIIIITPEYTEEEGARQGVRLCRRRGGRGVQSVRELRSST
uniref:Uncharacterized protein n=1 Tax=Knipowitschia caucasica TaxID=637954 RepID=A0AAV2KDG2_KNICA